ncbi:MAG: lysostaphin resistance A-like protein [Leptonema sp. (in: bacteria)]
MRNSNLNLKSRFFFILFLIFLILVSIFYRDKLTNKKEKLTNLINQKIDLIYKIYFIQILIVYDLPEENKKNIKEQIFTQIDLLSKEFKNNQDSNIQNYIIYLHFSEKKPINLEGEKYIKFINIINDIYLYKKKDIDLSSELFKYPLGKIALLDYYKYTDQEKFRSYYESLLRDIQPYQIAVFLFVSLTFLSFIVSIFVIKNFFTKPAHNFYGNFIRSLPFPSIWVFLEAFIIYLFFMIPINLILLKVISISETQYLIYQITYTIFSFGIVLIYLYNELDKRTFLNLFMFKVYPYHKEHFLESIANIENHTEEKQSFFSKLEKSVTENKIKPLSPLKEFFYGFLGFIVIFPLSLAILFASILVSGREIQFEDAHPISFLIPEYLFEVLILAVVLAPITEEFIFRNLAYGVFRYRFSVFASGILSGFLFASLHPQGFVAFPYLVFLGFSLAILREFRPGIFASITTHFFVNFLALLMNYLVFKNL